MAELSLSISAIQEKEKLPDVDVDAEGVGLRMVPRGVLLIVSKKGLMMCSEDSKKQHYTDMLMYLI